MRDNWDALKLHQSDCGRLQTPQIHSKSVSQTERAQQLAQSTFMRRMLRAEMTEKCIAGQGSTALSEGGVVAAHGNIHKQYNLISAWPAAMPVKGASIARHKAANDATIYGQFSTAGIASGLGGLRSFSCLAETSCGAPTALQATKEMRHVHIKPFDVFRAAPIRKD
eukprot:scaffold253357_cov19-Prasinocladus_malaysianus.AAC.1